ncbi:uncharacterized protein LOC141689046 [Apium graveolens]|uniref:uncharacterized protein LOC141689046 n=1 Tax=Apium graveolens TaxID=4045 RepID=UPI003D78C798
MLIFLELGLPHYNLSFRAIMSSFAYAVAFNSLGLAYKTTKGAPGPGFDSADAEGGAESSAPQNVVDLANVPLPDDPVVQEIFEDEAPRPKKRKSVPGKPPRGQAAISNRVICDSEGKGLGGEPVKVGTKSLVYLVGFMSSIPSEEDWDEVEGSSMAAAFKRVTEQWGQVGSSISICSDIAFIEVREANNRTRAEKIRADGLKDELDEAREGFKTVESGLNEQLNDEKAQTDGLAKEVEKLKVDLATKEDLNKEAITLLLKD